MSTEVKAKKFELPKEYEEKLGQVPDREIAEALNVSLQTIFYIRQARGIKPNRKHAIAHQTSKLSAAEYDSLIAELGKVRDSHLARKYSVSREYVRQLRTKYQIAKFERQVQATV